MDAATHLFQPLATRRLGDQVYEHLIDAIASNRLPQGARIQEDALAAQMGVSKTPVREALRRLEAEGFIRLDPHRTPVVRTLGPGDVEELYRVREYLERLAVRTLAETRAPSVLEQLEACQAAAEARWAQGAAVAFRDSVEYNRQFHELIFAGAGNRRLQRMFQLIAVDVRRLAYQSIRVAGRQREAVDQHRAILNAVRAGEADEAERLIVRHVQQAREDLSRERGAAGDRRPGAAGVHP